MSIFQWEDKEESYQRKGRRRKNKTKAKQSYTCSRPTTQGRDLQQFTAALTKEDTSAELDTLGTLSTMACFMYLSMACNIVPCEKRGRKSIDAQPLVAEYKCLDKNKCTTCSKSPQKNVSPNSKNSRETSVPTPEDSVTQSLQQGSLRAESKTPKLLIFNSIFTALQLQSLHISTGLQSSPPWSGTSLFTLRKHSATEWFISF